MSDLNKIDPCREVSAKIFYGAGHHARENIKFWIENGIVPVCFVDRDVNKHHRFIEVSVNGEDYKIEILSLNDALLKYPDYEISIAVLQVDAYKIYYDLIENCKIPEYRIKLQPGAAEHEKTPKHCNYIGDYFVIDGGGFKCCCDPQNMVNNESVGCISKDIESYQEFCSKLQEDLNKGMVTSCEGCRMLEDGAMETYPQIKSVNLSTGLLGGDKCNFKCDYCTYGETLGACEQGDTVLDIVKYLAENLQIDNLMYASGEITVSPYCEEILKIWQDKKWNGMIATNASIYSEGIEELLRKKQISINVSVDAGTPETFEKVKGRKFFDRVTDNLIKYSETGGKIELKYVLMDGINDSIEDIDGFIDLSKKTGSNIIISRDSRNLNNRMSEKEFSAFMRLKKRCEELSIEYSIVDAYFNTHDIERITSQPE